MTKSFLKSSKNIKTFSLIYSDDEVRPMKLDNAVRIDLWNKNFQQIFDTCPATEMDHIEKLYRTIAEVAAGILLPLFEKGHFSGYEVFSSCKHVRNVLGHLNKIFNSSGLHQLHFPIQDNIFNFVDNSYLNIDFIDGPSAGLLTNIFHVDELVTEWFHIENSCESLGVKSYVIPLFEVSTIKRFDSLAFNINYVIYNVVCTNKDDVFIIDCDQNFFKASLSRD